MPCTSTDALNDKLGSIRELPTLPMVLRQVHKIMANPRSNMNQIAAVVAKDQALASRTIRLVNSAAYALRTRVTSITNAIVVLGLNTLHQIMLGLAVVKMFKGAGGHGFSPEQFWRHAFATALLSKKIATLEHYDDPEECFIAGLLHDMGRLACEQFLTAEFIEALALRDEENISLAAAEKRCIGFDHGEAGAWLGGQWGIPIQLSLAMAYHHAPRLLPDEHHAHTNLVAIIAAADAIAHENAIGDSGETRWLADAPRQFTALTPAQQEAFAAETAGEVDSTVEEWSR